MKNYPHISDDEWEKICKRCGQCCHQKIILKGVLFVDANEKCEHLKDNKCCIYDTRLTTKACLSIRETINQDYLLPSSCPYTKLRSDYKGFDIPDKEMQKKIDIVLFLIAEKEQELGRELKNKEFQFLFVNYMETAKDL